jgi:hypothetical protein
VATWIWRTKLDAACPAQCISCAASWRSSDACRHAIAWGGRLVKLNESAQRVELTNRDGQGKDNAPGVEEGTVRVGACSPMASPLRSGVNNITSESHNQCPCAKTRQDKE